MLSDNESEATTSDKNDGEMDTNDEESIENNKMTEDEELSENDDEMFINEENIEEEFEEKVKFNKPTTFKFITLDTIRDFDLLWQRMAYETIEIKNEKNKSLNERMELIKNDLNQNNDEKFTKIQEIPGGGKSITFMIPNKKIKKNRDERQKNHIEERKNLRRSAGPVMKHFGKRLNNNRNRYKNAK